jgi:uncharacterized protein YjbJ (UPF0337 family)
MKSSVGVAAKGKFSKSKGQNQGRVGKVMNDPTLEGKDENKVGRVQRKILRDANGTKK